LLLLGFSLTGVFALSEFSDPHLFSCQLTGCRPHTRQRSCTRHSSLHRNCVRFPSTVHHRLNYLLSTASEWSICSVRSESTSKIPKKSSFRSIPCKIVGAIKRRRYYRRLLLFCHFSYFYPHIILNPSLSQSRNGSRRSTNLSRSCDFDQATVSTSQMHQLCTESSRSNYRGWRSFRC
jgi:hypothetical protein